MLTSTQNLPLTDPLSRAHSKYESEKKQVIKLSHDMVCVAGAYDIMTEVNIYIY